MIGLLFVFLFVYFLPPFVALSRGHASTPTIAILTLLLGWTGAGWVFALIWAFTGNVRTPPAPRDLMSIALGPPSAPRELRNSVEDAARAARLRRVESLQAQVERCDEELKEIGRERPADGVERVDVILSTMRGVGREMERLKAEMHDSAAPTPLPPRASTTPLTRRVSHEGRAYYRNEIPPPLDGYLQLHGPALFDIPLAGCLHHQPELDAVSGGRRDAPVYLRVNALVFPQPDNPHDPNAVAVAIEGAIVGYIPRDDAPAFRAELAAIGGQGAFACRALIESGWPEWHVKLDANRPLETR